MNALEALLALRCIVFAGLGARCCLDEILSGKIVGDDPRGTSGLDASIMRMVLVVGVPAIERYGFERREDLLRIAGASSVF